MAAIIQIEERRARRVWPSIQGTDAIFGRRAFAWSAVWAGSIAAVAMQLLCGLAVDTRLYLLGGQTPMMGISVLAGIWFLVYMSGSMYVAGLIAGQTGGEAGNRMLHGFVTWALTTVIGFLAMTFWGTDISLGHITSLANEWGTSGMVAPAWMLAGLVLGLISVLFGSNHADYLQSPAS